MTVRTDFGGAEDVPFGLALRPDGSIVLAGFSGNAFAIASYNANGYLNNAFGGSGTVTTAIGSSTALAWDVALQADGKALAAGAATIGATRDFVLARYNTNGTLDA